MRVLHINSYYNGCKFYTNLFNEQILKGIDLSVYVPIAKGTAFSPSDFGDYTIIRKNHGKHDRWFFHLKHHKIYKDIKQQYDDIDKYQVIHAHSLFSNGYIAFRLKKEYGIPYIVSVRDTDVNVFFKRMPHLRKLGLEILKQANKVIFLSSTYRENALIPYLKSKLLNEIKDKSVVIPNGIDSFWLNNKPNETHRIRMGEINIVFAGRIIKRKNIPTTIKACEILINRGYNVNYTIAGRVDDEEIFQSFKNKSFVSYVGPKTKEELIKLYRDNDIFVMPSITETFGLVYAEALSQGLPVIYSRGQGFDGQFDEGLVGYHVDCFNASEIADRIINILERYNEITLNCTKLSNRFDWEKFADEYAEIYRNIIK